MQGSCFHIVVEQGGERPGVASDRVKAAGREFPGPWSGHVSKGPEVHCAWWAWWNTEEAKGAGNQGAGMIGRR